MNRKPIHAGVSYMVTILAVRFHGTHVSGIIALHNPRADEIHTACIREVWLAKYRKEK